MTEQYVDAALHPGDLRHLLDHWLPGSESGRSGLVLGEPGGGQRAVAQALERRARVTGVRVASLWVAPGRPRLLSMSGLAEMLGATDPDTTEPATLARHLRRALRGGGGGASAAPLLVLVHGTEELPADDAAILEDLLAQPPDARLLIVATAATRRADGTLVGRLPGLVERVTQSGRCHVARLAPTSPEDIAALVEAELGAGAATTRFVRELTRLTAGRLDVVQDCLAHVMEMEGRLRAELLSGSRSVEALPAPMALGMRAQASLQDLPAEVRPAAEVVATALALWGLPAALGTLHDLTRLPADDVEDAVAQLERAGLVRETEDGGDIAVEFVEPLAARAVAEQASPLARRRLHRRAAEVLERQRDARGPLSDEETVALGAHLLAAAAPMDVDRAALVGSAARILVARGRFADARERLQDLDRALRTPTDAARPASALPGNLAALLAETLSRSGEWDAAQAVLSAPEPEPRTEGAVRAEMRRARDRVALGQDQEAWTIYQRVVGDENPSRDPAITMARVEAARVLQTLGMIEEGAHHARAAHREALDRGDERVAARALISLHSILLVDGAPHAALEVDREAYTLARRAGDRSTIARATSAIGGTLVDSHSVDRGLPWLRRAIRQAEACDDFPTASWTSVRLANALAEMGDLHGAERLALRAMHQDTSLHRMRALPRSHALLRTIDALRGSAPEGRPEVLQFWHGRELLDRGYALNAEVVALYRECMAAEDPRGAYEAATTAVRLFQQIGGRGRFLRCELIPRQVDAALAMGDLGAAEEATDDLAVLSQAGESFPLADAEVEAATGRVALARGDLDSARTLLRRAAEAFEATGYHLRRARTLRALAEASIAAGQPEEALPALDEAHQVLSTAGLIELKDVRALYQRIGRRPPRLTSNSRLSEREVEVARLAGRGLTDAEIASTLGIQRRTVTTHMHNILRKRGLRSRVELKGLVLSV